MLINQHQFKIVKNLRLYLNIAKTDKFSTNHVHYLLGKEVNLDKVFPLKYISTSPSSQEFLYSHWDLLAHLYGYTTLNICFKSCLACLFTVLTKIIHLLAEKA